MHIFHKWTEWKIIMDELQYDIDKTYDIWEFWNKLTQFRQQKSCLVCGKIKVRRIKI